MNRHMEEILKTLEAPMLETLKRWVAIPSVKQAPAPGAPFGEPARRALEVALGDCEALGFKVQNVDNYAGHADLGEGETSDALAILGHLDVVPVGDGWTLPPFEPTIKDGKIYGRGTADDKGPVVAALYAMVAVKKAGVPLKRKVRLILGTDEESGSGDMAYYGKKCPMPRMGFSPDADYPIINIEKGGMHVELNAPLSDEGLQVLKMQVGERFNVVPGLACAYVAGDEALVKKVSEMTFDFPVSAKMEDGAVRIDTVGITSHAAMPELGRNAIGQMLLVFKALGVKGALETLADKIGMTYYGENMGVAVEDKISGKLTVNMGIMRIENGVVYATLDLRCPVLTDLQGVAKLIKMALSGVDVTIPSTHAPHHVAEDSELVTKLLSAYTAVTGREGRAMAIGGGTYAKCLEEGVAFGALFPGEEEMAHQADEYMSIDSLNKNLRIFTEAILRLCAANEEA